MSGKQLLFFAGFCAITIWFALFLSDTFCSRDQIPLTPAALRSAYLSAVQDAKTAEPSEVYRHLTAITPHNPALIWRQDTQPPRLLVLTWTGWDGYLKKVGQGLQTQGPVWVTAVPELRDFCRQASRKGADLPLRLEQLLGLPPDSGKQYLVELWVNTADLFRPSPDPEITDHEAEPDFQRNPSLVTLNADHVSWFNQLKATSYGDDGYPWTRLGYTYDWGNARSEIGLSEFVIRRESRVLVHTVSSLDAYCRP